MHKSSLLAVVSVVALGFFGSCEFYKIQKSTDWQKKYQAAITYYEEEEYNKASILFEEVIPIIRGSEQAEKAEFYFAYSNFYQRQYILSAHYFKRFYDTFRASKFAEEALYMHAYSLYMQSPSPNLDQAETREAIQAFQMFVNRYPSSTFREPSLQIVQEMQEKLELKAYNNAVLYNKLSRHKAAIIAFENFLVDYPDSKFREEVIFRRFESQYMYAERSIDDKQMDRYKEAVTFYQVFIDRYPESRFVEQAEKMYDSCLEAIGKLQRQNS